MSEQHLITNRHYRLAITSPEGELVAFHIERFSNDDVEVACFIKDEDRFDEAVEVLHQSCEMNARDAHGKLRAGLDSVYLWDWELVKWALATCLESPPTTPDDFPF